MKCAECDGTGVRELDTETRTVMVVCVFCDGTGEIEAKEEIGE
jgi:DnaJ-class molecular chaperone